MFFALPRLSLAVASGDYSLAVVLLIAMAFSYCTTWAIGAQALVVAAHGLSSCGSPALEHRLNSCATLA